MSDMLSYYPDSVATLSLKDYFALLLNNTDASGNLYIPDEESICALEESKGAIHLIMYWDEASVENFLKEIEQLKTVFSKTKKVAELIGKDMNDRFVVFHADRYVKLLNHPAASKVLLDNEFRLLALNLAIQRFSILKELVR